jgi:hypothetical protein
MATTRALLKGYAIRVLDSSVTIAIPVKLKCTVIFFI